MESVSKVKGKNGKKENKKKNLIYPFSLLPFFLHYTFPIFLCYIFLCCIRIVYGAEDSVRTSVSGDNVNVRARPDVNSEIVTQLKLGEEVTILEREGEWVKIIAPKHTKCWINNETIDGNIIRKDSVNIRSGPGIAYPVLARLPKDTKIKPIETFNEWTKIEPPCEFGVWVNSKYLEQKDEKEKPSEGGFLNLQAVATPLPEEKKPEIVSVPSEQMSGIELISYAGRLEDLGVIINRPGTYKLLGDTGRWLCIVKSPEINVNPYVNRIVRIEGVVVAKSSSWDVPVIELKRLNIIK